MPQAFDAQNPPFDRLTHEESDVLRAALDIAYFRPGETVIEKGKSADHLHVIIRGAVEERDGEDVQSVLGPKDSFDARALVHGAAGDTFVSVEETLCYLVPKAVILDLIRRNAGFAAYFYSQLSSKLAAYARRQEADSFDQVLRARVSDIRLHAAAFIDGEATIVDAGRMMRDHDTNALFVRDGERIGVVTGMNLSKAAVLGGLPLDTRVREVSHFEVVAVDVEDFVFEAIIKMTRHNKRRLAVRSNGRYSGMLEDIDILGLFAGNPQLIPGRIDRARGIDDLVLPARDIQAQVARLERQGVEVEVIAEITSDLNRRLLAKVFEFVAPESIRKSGCLMVMGSEGRREQTVRTDQDNGLLLAERVPDEDLARFRGEFTEALERFGFPPCPGNVMVRNPQWSQPVDTFVHQIRDWVLTPNEESAMNLGIFFDAETVAGRADLLTEAKSAMCTLMRGESAFLARFARAIDLFEDASAGMLTSLMASVGVASGVIHLKKSGTFPIVHGIRTLSIDRGILETPTKRRIDLLVGQGRLGEDIGRDLKSALSYFMEVRLRSQLKAIKTGRPEEEAVVRLAELSTRDRDLLRDALKVVRRFRELIRHSYHLGQF